MKIIAFDVETANRSPTSLCAAGIAVFEDGHLTHSRHWLVRPPKGHGFFLPEFIDIHGITWFKVKNAPEFSALAPEILAYLTQSDLVVAHNASFDTRILQNIITHYEIKMPRIPYMCTLQLARRVWPHLPNHQLPTVAAHIGHTFQHHHAQADAEAAGRIMLALLHQTHSQSPTDLTTATGIQVLKLKD